MRNFVLLLSSAMCCSALVGEAAYGQAAPQKTPDGLGDIIVTAERRSQNVQKVAQSVVAISGSKLEELGVHSVSDLASFVPGVTIKPGNAPSIFIRGIGTSLVSVTGDPGVAVHIDGVFQTRSTALNLGLFDLDRVEVLEGPQGTLYGRGSIGGSVNIITAAPKMKLEAAVSGDLGNYSDRRGEAMVNVPIDQKTGTAIRVAFEAEQHDPYASNGADNGRDAGIRLRLKSSPLPGLTIGLNGSQYISHTVGVAFYPTRSYSVTEQADPDKWLTFVNQSNDFARLKVNEESINVDYDLGFATLSFLPSWTKFIDDRRSSNLATIGGVAGTSSPVLSDLDSTTSMQELHLSSERGSHVTWVTGLYHLTENNNYVVANGRIAGLVRTNSKSAFAQATVPVLDKFRLVGGVRYTDEAKDQFTNVNITFHKKWSVWNYRGSIEYDIADKSMVYATYSTGFKAGGFFVSTPPNSYDPETVKVIELGSKNRFFDNSLQVNAALYYENYKGYQVNVTIVPAFVGATSAGVFNGGNAKIKGAQLDVTYQLTHRDRLELSGNLTNAKFTSITVTGTSAMVGDHLPSTAKYSGNFAYTHDFPVSSGTISFRAETHLESSSWLSLNHSAITRQAPYSKSDLTLSYNRIQDKITLSAWVRNLENVAVRGSIVETVNNQTYTLGPPRTYGISVSKKF